ncbi:hypothetical protein JHK82_032666 [Glycine max]|nr:hypothetical protein JHK82_032666 [Glycine max]
MASLYDVLGISVGASCIEIKAAYRKLARTHHPDVVAMDQKESSANQFMMIHSAYSTLSDPEKRAQYDREIYRYRRSANIAGRNQTFSYAGSGRKWETDQSALNASEAALLFSLQGSAQNSCGKSTTRPATTTPSSIIAAVAPIQLLILVVAGLVINASRKKAENSTNLPSKDDYENKAVFVADRAVTAARVATTVTIVIILCYHLIL